MTPNLMQLDPILETFRNRLDSVFGRSPAQQQRDDPWFTMGEWSPSVDIIEDEKEYLIKAELPEVKKEDVTVTVENGVLLIKGERKMEREESKKTFHRVERSYGSFLRSFAVPEDADSEKIDAEFKNGVLCIHLTKSEKAKPKQIDVKVS
jgi:HSP20 family protein